METKRLDGEIDRLEAYKSNDVLSEHGIELLNEFKAIKQVLKLQVVAITLPSNEEINIESNKQATCINGMGNEYQNLSKYLGFVNCINWLKDKNKVKR